MFLLIGLNYQIWKQFDLENKHICLELIPYAWGIDKLCIMCRKMITTIELQH